LTDAEWALVGSLIPPAKRGGQPRTVNVREVLNAIFYVLWTGCQWKALPIAMIRLMLRRLGPSR
jgi:putative transposase